MTTKMICKVCDKEFVVFGDKRKSTAKYCSPKCYGIAQRIPIETIICEICKIGFKPSRSNIRNQRFCSRKCFGASKAGSNPYLRCEDIPISKLSEYIWLDEETGFLYWKRNPDFFKKTNRKIGDEAGQIYGNGKYKQFNLLGKVITAHRAAWALYNGRWPEGDVDHWDRNPVNNRPSNLREVTKSQNEYNKEARTPTGYKGVYAGRNGKYRARLFFDGKRRNGGTFNTPEEAYAARLELEKKYGVYEFSSSSLVLAQEAF